VTAEAGRVFEPPRRIDIEALKGGGWRVATEHEVQFFADQATCGWVIGNLLHPGWRKDIAGEA